MKTECFGVVLGCLSFVYTSFSEYVQRSTWNWVTYDEQFFEGVVAILAGCHQDVTVGPIRLNEIIRRLVCIFTCVDYLTLLAHTAVPRIFWIINMVYRGRPRSWCTFASLN